MVPGAGRRTRLRGRGFAVGCVAAALLASCTTEEPSLLGSPRPTVRPLDGSTAVALPGRVNGGVTIDITGRTRIEIELRDFLFSPTFLSASDRQRVEVELVNEGEQRHTFTVDALGIDELLGPGDAAELAFVVSGDVVFYCRFHRGRGMQGAFF